MEPPVIRVSELAGFCTAPAPDTFLKRLWLRCPLQSLKTAPTPFISKNCSGSTDFLKTAQAPAPWKNPACKEPEISLKFAIFEFLKLKACFLFRKYLDLERIISYLKISNKYELIGQWSLNVNTFTE